MDEELWRKAKEGLYAEVDSFMAKQREYMTDNPDDFKSVLPGEFVTFFIESF